MNARILHLGYSSNKPIGGNWEKATFSFGLQRGPNLLLNAPSYLGLERVFDSILGYKCEQEGCEARFDKWTLLVKHRKVHHQTGLILL